MELPFLKNKRKNQGGGGPVEVERVSDGGSQDRLVGIVADEILSALQTRDRAGFREAFRAFVHIIQEQDEAEDAGI